MLFFFFHTQLCLYWWGLIFYLFPLWVMHFMLYLGNLCLIQGNKDLLLCCFIILAFTLKSLIHFGLTFLYGTRCGSKFCLFVCFGWGLGKGVDIWLFQRILLKRLLFFHWVLMQLRGKNDLVIYRWACFWMFCSV